MLIAPTFTAELKQNIVGGVCYHRSLRHPHVYVATSIGVEAFLLYFVIPLSKNLGGLDPGSNV